MVCGVPRLPMDKRRIVDVGLDIGSTTIKAVALDGEGRVVFGRYERHAAKVAEKTIGMLTELRSEIGADALVRLTLTGSIGLGVAERMDIGFVQEVVCATNYMRLHYPRVPTLIDIGGEDAKVVFYREGQSPDLRMNGNCAGGTGAFIDQMAILLDVSIDELNELALRAERIYPIASRCGVFCKTDIQNLVAKNASRPDIAASIFHAVAVQTVSTLSHGQDIVGPVLLCGGPLTFIPALRHAFANYLHMDEERDLVVPERSNLIPAHGAAIAGQRSHREAQGIDALIETFRRGNTSTYTGSKQLKALFVSEEEWKQWQAEKNKNRLEEGELKAGVQRAVLGIDSGSTTTKIVVLDEDGRLLYSFYDSNKGNPIDAVARGLDLLKEECSKRGTDLRFVGSCSTGYGEDLIRTAFGLGAGVIETIAHFLAARHISPNVSFILDIGGQDMKAIFIEDGVINHIEINEACSSGCGTFIETFAKSMNYSVPDFAREACLGSLPCDLGTRCTVFMNSKVKQVLREGATIGDIASGLSYSVINNCLHKVLKIKNSRELGDEIVVQGGTMHNDAVVRALELLTQKTVSRSNKPELMGAYGCALYSMREARTEETGLEQLLRSATFETRTLQCRGCENNCLVNRYKFRSGRVFYSGNKCEKVFNNQAQGSEAGVNMYEYKLHKLFDRPNPEGLPEGALNIGIPRVLNMFEEYPFWHRLLTEAGLRVTLSDPSTYKEYERGVKWVMSDNICFPAKLVHSHILNLQEKGVDRILLPYVVFEAQEETQNSFNCPIVSGYSDVVRNTMSLSCPLDSPPISFKDEWALRKQLFAYLRGLGVGRNRISHAIDAALEEYRQFVDEMAEANLRLYDEGRKAGKLTILLAGRPYHADPLVQHKLAEMVCSMGVNCLTADVVRNQDVSIEDVHFISQWSFPGHVFKAAKWVAEQGKDVQFLELTSFGCGPDAFMLDEIYTLLHRHGKALTQLKIDDVCNVGSLRLRVRSVVDSIKLSLSGQKERGAPLPFETTPIFSEEERMRRNKIIVPYFTDFITPLIPSFMQLAGYDADVLPLSDTQAGDYGLSYANNEICYPATLIVGDIIKAFDTGLYDPDTTTALITQTGGQCRASNYISLIKKALVEAGYPQVPVISFSMSKNLQNNQPGFQLNWRKLMPIAITTILYSDAIAKMYFAAAPRENVPGAAQKLRDKYLNLGRGPVVRNNSKGLLEYLQMAAQDFDKIVVDKECRRVGIVGEIYLKFNSYAQRGITQWLVDNGLEVEPPVLLDFFLQSFVNQRVKHQTKLEHTRMPQWLLTTLYRIIESRIKATNKACRAFRYYRPFDNIYELADNAKDIVSLTAQFGEGWLLPGEVATFARHGISHVISLQPFGCIANHIISKGIEKRLRQLYPHLNFLSLDFDSGVSDVNIANRLLLFANDILE